jgi:hypothetical protein
MRHLEGNVLKDAVSAAEVITKVKPEAANAVIELLMISGKTPETC